MHFDRRTFSLSLLAAGMSGRLSFSADEKTVPVDKEPRLAVAFSEETQRFGLACLKLKDPRNPERPKLLTRDERGNTNNTVVRLNGYEYIWGRESAGAGVVWAKDKGKVLKEVRRADGLTTYSSMNYENERVRVTQWVRLVVGAQTRLYDTALVEYVIWNADNKKHTVGLRAMLHTSFGGAGFFVVPGDKDMRQVDGKEIFEGAKVPEYVSIPESAKLNDPNAFVAQLGLKINGLETPDKVVLCRWPQEWGASEARWDWPYAANEDKKRDPCVALYWSKLTLEPGAVKTLGYSYGLGRIKEAPVEKEQ